MPLLHASGVRSEDGGRVEVQGGPDGGRAATNGDDECEAEDYREEHWIEGGGDGREVSGRGGGGVRGSGGEDAGAEPGGQAGAQQVAEGSGKDGEQADFGVEEQRDGVLRRAERTHEADLLAALEDGRSHGGGDGESGGKQGGAADEPHQAGDALQDDALGLLDAANLLRVGAGERLLD